MPYYYHVGIEKLVTILDKDNHPLDIAKKDVLGALKFTPESAQKDQNYLVFENYKTAVKYADHMKGKKNDNKQHYPIFEVELTDSKKLKKVSVPLSAENKLSAFETAASNTTLVNALFTHASKDVPDIRLVDKASFSVSKEEDSAAGLEEDSFEEVDLSDSEEGSKAKKSSEESANDDSTDEKKKKQKTNLFKSIGIPVGIISIAGAASYFSGLTTVVATLFSLKTGIILPMVGIAAVGTQVSISVLAGVFLYGGALGIYHGGKFIFEAMKNTYDNYKKTKAQRYQDEIKTTAAEVRSLEKKTGLPKGTIERFKKLVENGSELKFKSNGDLDEPEKQPKVKDKAVLLKWELSELKAYSKAIDAKDDKQKAKLEKEMKNGPRLSLSSS